MTSKDCNGRYHDDEGRFISAAKELAEQRWEAHEKIHELERHALALQAVEYGRRLDQLNHAHEQSLEDRGDFETKAGSAARDAHIARIEEQLTNIREGLIGRDHYISDQKALEANRRSDAAAVDIRFQPLEKSVASFKLFVPIGVFIGALAVYIIEKFVAK